MFLIEGSSNILYSLFVPHHLFSELKIDGVTLHFKNCFSICTFSQLFYFFLIKYQTQVIFNVPSFEVKFFPTVKILQKWLIFLTYEWKITYATFLWPSSIKIIAESKLKKKPVLE